MKLDLLNLPDDICFLKKLVNDLVSTLKTNQELIAQLQIDLKALRMNFFGRRSEKGESPNQLKFFPEEPVIEPEKTKSSKQETEPEEKEDREEKEVGHGRNELPAHLPRKTKTYDLPPEEKICPDCRKELVLLGEETSEDLEYEPASFHVRKTVKKKYSCKCGLMAEASCPPKLIEKGLAGPGLLAMVLVAKYADHQPLSRISDIMAREDIHINRSTLCDWVTQVAAFLKPIRQTMISEILKSRVIQTDDTPVPVLAKDKTKRGYLWVYLGDKEHPDVVYDFSPGHSQEFPKSFLGSYQGYLQADAAPVYDNLFLLLKIIEVACWAHARRKFFKAKDTDLKTGKVTLAFIRALYKIERRIKKLSPVEKRMVRQEFSVPLLDKFKKWLDKKKFMILPKSPMGKAIAYALKNWTALNRYTENGILSIDNNASERAIKNVVIGRKNWLFAGSNRGGENAAIIYTFVVTCKNHGINPLWYFKTVFELLPTWPESRYHELAPRNLKKTFDEMVARSQEAA